MKILIKNYALFITSVLILFFAAGCSKNLKLNFTMPPVEEVNKLDSFGEPVSALVRVFQLRGSDRFNQAQIKDLLTTPEETLKEDMVSQEKIKIYFEKELYSKIKVEKDARFVGIIANIHKDNDYHAWKRIYGVNDKELGTITIALKKIIPDENLFVKMNFSMPKNEKAQVDQFGEQIPALVKIFLLKKTDLFSKAEADDLFSQSEKIVEGDMESIYKLNVLPEKIKSESIKITKETKYFGMVAKLKKDGDPRSWKKIYGIDNRDLQNIEIELKRGKLDSIAFSFIPTNEMNADSSGNPLPATMRIYKLKSVEKFKVASFNSLWKKGTEILGDELIDMETINVYPERTQRVIYKRNQQTRYYGLVGIFRKPESDNSWKKIIDISDKKYDEIEELKTYLYRNSIDVQP